MSDPLSLAIRVWVTFSNTQVNNFERTILYLKTIRKIILIVLHDRIPDMSTSDRWYDDYCRCFKLYTKTFLRANLKYFVHWIINIETWRYIVLSTNIWYLYKFCYINIFVLLIEYKIVLNHLNSIHLFCCFLW